MDKNVLIAEIKTAIQSASISVHGWKRPLENARGKKQLEKEQKKRKRIWELGAIHLRGPGNWSGNTERGDYGLKRHLKTPKFTRNDILTVQNSAPCQKKQKKKFQYNNLIQNKPNIFLWTFHRHVHTVYLYIRLWVIKVHIMESYWCRATEEIINNNNKDNLTAFNPLVWMKTWHLSEQVHVQQQPCASNAGNCHKRVKSRLISQIKTSSRFHSIILAETRDWKHGGADPFAKLQSQSCSLQDSFYLFFSNWKSGIFKFSI